uniref:OBP47-like domain-containing protein n=1 Tax=Anopheles christyi TaxID=43041 RepID=A0A182K056_9DIPT
MVQYICVLGAIFLAVQVVVAHRGKDTLGCHNGTSVTVDECCAIPMLADKSVLEKCKSENPFKPPQKDEKGQRAHPGECIAACVLKSMGALKNDQIDQAAFRKAVEPVVKANPAFGKLIDETIKKCHENVTFDSAFTRQPVKPICEPVAKEFINCVYGTLFQVQSQPPAPDASCFQSTAVTAEDCCKIPKPIDSAVMDKCKAENPKPSQMPAPGVPRTEGCCIVQCAMMESGGFANNALNTDAIKRSMANTLGADPNFGSIVNGAVDTCARQIQNDPAYSVAPISSSPDRAGCSFIPQGFVNCMYTTLFKSCPAAVWTESGDCQALKTKLDSGCPFFLLMGRGHRN